MATLVVPTGTGPLIIPTPKPTTSANVPAQDVTSVLTPTSAAPTASTSSTLGTSPVTTGPTDTSAAVAPDETPTVSQQQLGSAQIVGIVLGCLAVVVFGILLVFLARCVRRRRFGGDPEAGFTKMRDSLSFGRRSHPNSPPEIQISKPLHSSPSDRAYQWPTNPPRPQQTQQMQQPAGVGLAVSPYRSQQAASDGAAMRAAQRGTPTVILSPPVPTPSTATVENTSSPKPALTLAIPKAPKPQTRPPVNSRESIVTEFAEDGEGDSVPNTGNIWRPPATDPQSATTYFFADKGGNWILRNKSDRKLGPREPAMATTEVELPSPSDKTKAERAQGWVSPGALVEPLRVPSRNNNQQKLGSPISFKDQQQQQQQRSSRRDNRSSSVYSPYDAPLSVTPGPQNPLPANNLPPPDTYFAMIRDGRELAGPRNSARKSARKAAKRRSNDSSTSIESAAALPYEDEALIEDEPQINLSPVAESPRTPLTPGQSPVTYPRIRRSDGLSPQQRQGPSNMQQGLSLFPMPARQGSLRQIPPPGSTPGLTLPVKKAGVPMMDRVADPKRPMGANAPVLLSPNQYTNRNPALQRTGSPETRQGVLPSMKQQRQRQQQGQAAYWTDQQAEVAESGERRGPYELATDGQQARRPSPAVQQLQQERRLSPAMSLQEIRPSPAIQQLQQQRRPSPAGLPSRSMSPADSSSQNSLLAKRRGVEKAAALSLADQEAKRKPKGWKRQEVEMPPITPGIRMMTPTRKGDDLFLDIAR